MLNTLLWHLCCFFPHTILLHWTFRGTFNFKKIFSISSRPYVSIAVSFVSISAETSAKTLLFITSFRPKCVFFFRQNLWAHLHERAKAINSTIMWKKLWSCWISSIGNPTYILNQNYWKYLQSLTWWAGILIKMFLTSKNYEKNDFCQCSLVFFKEHRWQILLLDYTEVDTYVYQLLNCSYKNLRKFALNSKLSLDCGSGIFLSHRSSLIHCNVGYQDLYTSHLIKETQWVTADL